MISNALTDPYFTAEAIKTKLLKKHFGVHRATMDGFFSDVADFAWDAVTGLYSAIGGVFSAAAMTVKKITETIILTVRAVIGDVSWDEVSHSLGEVFQNVSNVVVVMNPYRNVAEFAKENELTAHAFQELDKFSGGMITNAVNVSDVAQRSLRGDPISKEELLQDAIFIIQVVSIVFGGPAAAGMFTGSLIGKEVCKHQTHAKDACMATFMIIGAAAGDYGSAVTGANWGTSYWNAEAARAAAQAEIAAGEVAASQLASTAFVEAGSAEAQRLALAASTSFFDHISPQASEYLLSRGLEQGTQELVRVCNKQDWLGNSECEILATVASNYVRNELTTNVPWEEFMANEIARIGAEQLMLQWFPENSKEHAALKRKWEIKYVDGGVQAQPSSNIKGIMLALAAGAGMLLLGGAS